MSVKNSVPESGNWFDDPDFQNKLVLLLVQDHQTLRNCAPLLSPEDFKPSKGMADGRARWLVAERALEYFEKHHEPLGNLVRADVLEYAAQLNLGSGQINEVRDYLKLIKTIKPTAPDALVDKVIRFKSQILKKNAINELAELQSSGMLTDEKWEEISHKILSINNITQIKGVEYLATLENRIDRRISGAKRSRIPWTFIEPLDAMIHTVGPKQLGLIIAPYKRGKSSFLLWLAVVLTFQGYNVLYVTLEDSQDVVEDRLDSIVTSVPLKSLVDKPNTLRRKFERYKNMVRARIRIYDGTGGGVTVPVIERFVTSSRDEGFIPHVCITDYDDEIVPVRKYREKRFETDETYRSYRQMLSRHNMIGWLAAQTQRDTRHLKILSGDKVAEDIGKARKVTCAISMGKGDWDENSIFLWVAAHKTDRMDIGCEIIPDLDRSLIYDREATSQAAKNNRVNP